MPCPCQKKITFRSTRNLENDSKFLSCIFHIYPMIFVSIIVISNCKLFHCILNTFHPKCLQMGNICKSNFILKRRKLFQTNKTLELHGELIKFCCLFTHRWDSLQSVTVHKREPHEIQFWSGQKQLLKLNTSILLWLLTYQELISLCSPTIQSQ